MEMEAPRVRTLDGLRGLAVAAVVAYHLGFLPGGWLGVDAFFTLSGFLITSLLLSDARHGLPDLQRFWRRRIRRLQPAAIVAVAVIVATAHWWARPGTGSAVRGDALASLFSLQNWHMLWSQQPYAAGAAPSAFQHFWSLAIEEQFYLVWPIVVAGLCIVARRRTRVAVLSVAIVGVMGSWVLLATYGLQRGYLSTGSRVGSILAGAALACVVRRVGDHPLPAKYGAIGVAGMALMWLGAGWPPHLPLAALLPVHTGFAILAILGATSSLGWGPLVGLGRVSYGVYLWHWPVIVILTPERLGQNSLTTDAIRLAVIAVLTAASWLLIERPVRHERVLHATRFAFPAGALAAACAVFVGASAIAPAPVWARATGELVQTRAVVKVVHRKPAGPKAPIRPQRVLVIGDSLPTSLLSGTDASGTALQIGEGHLLEQFAASGIRAASETFTSCPVLHEVIYANGFPRGWCVARVDQRLPAALAFFRPDLVVWFDVADAYEIQRADGTREEPMRSVAATLALRKRYAARLALISEYHAKTVFVSAGPDRDGHDEEDMRQDSMRSSTYLDSTLRAVAAAHPHEVVGVIEMGDLVCPGWQHTHHCADRIEFGNGGFFRGSDGMHYAGAGAWLAGAWLVGRVANLNLRG